jgi:hypothetical protein
MRIEGWMGRADQTTKVKGMFVRPEQIPEIGKRHPELGRLRLLKLGSFWQKKANACFVFPAPSANSPSRPVERLYLWPGSGSAGDTD